MHPIIADGGEMTVLRSLASYAYGKWDVTWPDSVPESHRPKLEDDRDFGYASKLDGGQQGRMARRFVRSDISIEAAEYAESGAVIPYTGFSNAESVLDEAAARTNGDVFFEREFTREHLGELEPWVDFSVGDLVPVTVWGRSLESVVRSIEAVTAQGAVIDWRVVVGQQLLRDDDGRERKLAELERDMAQEVRERKGDVSSARSAAVAAVAGERSAREAAIEAEASARKRGDEDEARNRQVALEAEERKRAADLKRIRDFLGGAGASDAALLSQLAAVNAQIIVMSDGKTQPAPGLLNSYLSLNTLLWEQQKVINDHTDKFKEQQKLIDRAQTGTMATLMGGIMYSTSLKSGFRMDTREAMVVKPPSVRMNATMILFFPNGNCVMRSVIPGSKSDWVRVPMDSLVGRDQRFSLLSEVVNGRKMIDVWKIPIDERSDGMEILNGLVLVDQIPWQ